LGALVVYKGEFRKEVAKSQETVWNLTKGEGSIKADSLEEFQEEFIVEYLDKLKTKLLKEKEREYSHDEIKELLEREIGKFHENDKGKLIDDLSSKLYKEVLFRWKIEGDIIFEKKNKKPTLSFSMLHDFFDLHQFRGTYSYSLNSIQYFCKMTSKHNEFKPLSYVCRTVV